MRPSRHVNLSRTPAAHALLATLAIGLACSGAGSVRGEYTSTNGTVFNFKSNGKVEITMTVFGSKTPTQEVDYAVEDAKIMLGPASMPRTVIPIDESGCFVFDTGLLKDKLCKGGPAGTKPST